MTKSSKYFLILKATDAEAEGAGVAARVGEAAAEVQAEGVRAEDRTAPVETVAVHEAERAIASATVTGRDKF
jgi:hypothetical protein